MNRPTTVEPTAVCFTVSLHSCNPVQSVWSCLEDKREDRTILCCIQCIVYSKALFTRYNRLSGRLLNPFYKPAVKPVVKPVVKPIWQPVGQQVVSRIQTSNLLFKPVVQSAVQELWRPIVSLSC